MEYFILEISEISFKEASNPFLLRMPGLGSRKAEKNLKVVTKE
jgi:hypothetical protein